MKPGPHMSSMDLHRSETLTRIWRTRERKTWEIVVAHKVVRDKKLN